TSFAVGKLYTRHFYTLAARRLAPDGALVVQSTSPLFAPRSFWCIARTIEGAGLSIHPYHAAVPSFGEWGFVLARRLPFEPPDRLAVGGLRSLDDATLRGLFVFGPDMKEPPVDTNRLDNQVLVQYHDRDWRKWD